MLVFRKILRTYFMDDPFGRPRLRDTIKTNFMTFQIVDPEICSILNF